MTWMYVIGALVIAFALREILNHPHPVGQSSSVRLIDTLANAFSSTVELEAGRLQFQYRYQDAVVIVSLRRSGHTRRQFIEVRIRGRQPPLRCEVYPDGGRQEDRSFLGMQDVEIGDDPFDRQYVIKTEDISLTKELLSDHVRGIIEDMRTSSDIHDVYVSLDHLRLTASKRIDPTDRQEAMTFIAGAVRLYDGILRASSNIPPDVEFQGAVTSPLETACQICGEPLQTKLVRCRRCKTLHHRDCWEYYGACSTYGCNQKRFAAVKPGRPPSEQDVEADKPPVLIPPAPHPSSHPPSHDSGGQPRGDQATSGGLQGSRNEQEREAQRRRHRRRRRRRAGRQREQGTAFARRLGRAVGRHRRLLAYLFLALNLLVYIYFTVWK